LAAQPVDTGEAIAMVSGGENVVIDRNESGSGAFSGIRKLDAM
jgi:hypothetical protein